ncbi:DNA replication/repair protein RecF [Sphingomonas montanisoli]|uniref:DNA replication and repair protein RecF n=1 Tax=Sphingomonas montanisoli TaxID=2606412 RepID=A0A5D9C3U4_9SPHN|nr:DNA replication/repair protein RecF [Sphingomonas montanisoli]TZG26349.1 DNA replication/repair protein RecF [Sphingomonas montanisoli]
MAVTRLALTDFRSHGRLLIEPGTGLVVLTGENGAGKTNLLEALSLLAPGRGLRGVALSDMARTDGPGGFAVAARLVDSTGEPIDIGTGTEPQAPDRRIVRINGAPTAANTLAEWLSLVWLTPAMDRLFVDTPGGRRRFLDRLVLALDPAHAAHATRYEAAVRDRNRLLGEETPPDPVWLDALEAAMAEHGDAVAQARAHMVVALNARIAAEPEGPFARPTLDIGGWNGSDLASELRQGRGRDRAAGRTLSGPHRSDLIVTHAAKGQPAARSSTGEQKALLLSLILAHADLVAERKGARPILLLDEVAAHLDPGRRAALFDRLAAGGGQIWMTGTEPALFEGADAWRMSLP